MSKDTLLDTLNRRDAEAGMTAVERRRRARSIIVRTLGAAAAATAIVTLAAHHDSSEPQRNTHATVQEDTLETPDNQLSVTAAEGSAPSINPAAVPETLTIEEPGGPR